MQARNRLSPRATSDASTHGSHSVRECHQSPGQPSRAWPTPPPEPSDANPLRASGVGRPAQALELAPEPLARPALTPDSHDPRSHLGDDGRRAVVLIACRGDGCPDTQLDRVHDLHDTLPIGDQGLDPVAGANLRRRLGRRPIHADVTALAQSRRKRAGLYQAHRTKPAIDARLGGCARVSHVD